jgi:hypothetical protein
VGVDVVHWREQQPGAPWDPDGAKTAEVFAAYCRLEDARDSRRRSVRAAIIVGLVAGLIEGATRILDTNQFLTVLLALAAVVVFAVLVEWRTEQTLKELTRR